MKTETCYGCTHLSDVGAFMYADYKCIKFNAMVGDDIMPQTAPTPLREDCYQAKGQS